MLPVPVYSGKTAGKRHLQVPRSAGPGAARRRSLWKTTIPSRAPIGSRLGWGGGAGVPRSALGLGRNSPAEPISGARCTAIGRSFLPSRPSPCGGRNFSAPKMNVTRVLGSCLGAWGSCLGSGAAGPARPGWDTPAPPKPRTFPGREIALPREMFGRGAGTRTGPNRDGTHGPRNPNKRRDARGGPPRADGRCSAQLPHFAWAFSFANQLSGRLSGAARSVHFLPTPGADLFPSRKVPAERSCLRRCRRPAVGPGTGGASIWASPWPGISERVLGPL